ncbi:hypothetical protein H6F92_21590 [Microcystis wesenbergii FACHB-1317]|uniref:hypothetical protein n=1 Tax=Microcystis TaxID=1125 RepID=UPI0016805386|nr:MULTISPECIES: hypothetical protein [Microcystis]MBD2291225.1 hypothetical protein [Microcystis wesenbergii FACHB-1317]UZO78002.1 hypothetical protein M8120_09030 [Microcystis aeruginosa str. Chao 1910]
MKTLELDRGLNFILSEKAVSYQLSVISYQLSVISDQLSAFFSLLPSPHTPKTQPSKPG